MRGTPPTMPVRHAFPRISISGQLLGWVCAFKHFPYIPWSCLHTHLTSPPIPLASFSLLSLPPLFLSLSHSPTEHRSPGQFRPDQNAGHGVVWSRHARETQGKQDVPRPQDTGQGQGCETETSRAHDERKEDPRLDKVPLSRTHGLPLQGMFILCNQDTNWTEESVRCLWSNFMFFGERKGVFISGVSLEMGSTVLANGQCV